MLIIRIILIILPITYMVMIWMQSSYFDPGSVHTLSSQISMNIILLIGICLELAHLFEFGLLYLFLIMAFLVFGKLKTKKEFLAAAIAILYGLIDEVHQHYVPFRSFSYFDLFKDFMGVWVIWLIVNKNYYNEDSRIGTVLRKITNRTRKNKHDVTF